MYNKAKLKAFVKTGTRKGNILILDKKAGWVSDGYAMYLTKPTISESVLQELFYKQNRLYLKYGHEVEDIPDLTKLLEYDYQSAPDIKLTPYIKDIKEYQARVFLDNNGEDHFCQQKYLDIISDFKECRFTQNRDTSPIYVWQSDLLIALILPIKHSDIEYSIIDKKKLDKLIEKSDKEIDFLKKELEYCRWEKTRDVEIKTNDQASTYAPGVSVDEYLPF